MEWRMLLQALFSFFGLLLLARLLGKKQISHLTFFDYIVGISIGNISGALSVDKNQDFVAAVQGLLVWSIIPLALNWLSKQSYWVRRVLNGKPTVVIQQGKILQQNVHREHMTVNDMMQLLREKNAFNLSQVEFAVLETNGKISVLKKNEYQPVTPSVDGIPVINESEPRIVILDGTVMEKTLRSVGYTKEWLLGELVKQGARNFKDVFLAQIDGKGNVYVDLFNDDVKEIQVKARPLVSAVLKKAQADLEQFAIETQDESVKATYTQEASELKELISNVEPYLRE